MMKNVFFQFSYFAGKPWITSQIWNILIFLWIWSKLKIFKGIFLKISFFSLSILSYSNMAKNQPSNLRLILEYCLEKFQFWKMLGTTWSRRSPHKYWKILIREKLSYFALISWLKKQKTKATNPLSLLFS